MAAGIYRRAHHAKQLYLPRRFAKDDAAARSRFPVDHDHRFIEEMNRLILHLAFATLVGTASGHAECGTSTRFGELTFKKGVAALGNMNLNSSLSLVGVKRVSVYSEDLWTGTVPPPSAAGLYLLRLLIDEPEATELSTGYVVLDLTGKMPVLSNVVRLRNNYRWEDNHYSTFQRASLHFGLYAPTQISARQVTNEFDRVQFTYGDGKLAENKGPWMGPPRPKTYTESDKTLPCANVANIPECLAEVGRGEATSRAKHRRKQPAISASASSAR